MRAIIVGAGLGGLSAAIALRRAGHEVVVLEQAQELAEVGAGIQVAPNASRLLERWGVREALAGRCVAAEHSNRRRWQDGRVLGSFPLGASAIERFGSSYLCMHRADLHAALLAVATEPGEAGAPAELRLGNAVQRVEPELEGEAVVHLVSGATLYADLVVGADGIRSLVRDHAFGARDAPLSGQITQRMVISLDSVELDAKLEALLESPDLNIWLGPNRHAVLHPVRGRAGVYLGVTTATTSPEQAARVTEGSIEELLSSMRTWDPCLQRLIEAADGLTSWPLNDRDTLPEWVRGRLCLIGDACHAMLPFQAQGAAQAMEDAAVLGSVFEQAGGGDVPGALERYAALRQPRAARVLEASRGNGDLFHFPDGPEQRARDVKLHEGSGDFESYLWLWAAAPDGTPLQTAASR